jgi:hypothetical protein
MLLRYNATFSLRQISFRPRTLAAMFRLIRSIALSCSLASVVFAAAAVPDLRIDWPAFLARQDYGSAWIFGLKGTF